MITSEPQSSSKNSNPGITMQQTSDAHTNRIGNRETEHFLRSLKVSIQCADKKKKKELQPYRVICYYRAKARRKIENSPTQVSRTFRSPWQVGPTQWCMWSNRRIDLNGIYSGQRSDEDTLYSLERGSKALSFTYVQYHHPLFSSNSSPDSSPCDPADKKEARMLKLGPQLFQRLSGDHPDYKQASGPQGLYFQALPPRKP